MAKIKEDVKPRSFEEELAALKKEFTINNENTEGIFVSSGSLALDIALGGKGWKLGRQASLVAWYGSGKTTTCLETIKNFQNTIQIKDPSLKYAYIDAEHSLDRKYIEDLGIDWVKFEETLFQPANGEQAFEYAKRLIKTDKVKLIIFDSVSGMRTQKEMEDAAGSSHLGLHARLLSDQVPVLKALAAKYGCLLIYVNQIREKIGVMFGSPETTQGGNAIPFFDDYRVEIRKTLEKDNGDKEDATGVTARFKVVKNKVAPPYKTGEYSIKFGKGIDRIQEIIEIGSDLEILYKHGQTVKLDKDTPEEQKFDLPVFMEMISDNPEFYDSLKTKILKTINKD